MTKLFEGALAHQHLSIALRTDREGTARLALPVGHPNENRQLRRRLDDPGGDWRVDETALTLPWSAKAVEMMTEADRRISVRFAVLRAWEETRRAATGRRGIRETILNLRIGDPLLGSQRLPDLLEHAHAADGPIPPLIAMAAEITANRLGVSLDGTAEDAARLREVAIGRRCQGRNHEIELTTFIRLLAVWWWMQTGRRPERQISGAGAGRMSSFVTFVATSAIDVSRSGQAEPSGIRSAIRREVERMEKSGTAPWPMG